VGDDGREKVQLRVDLGLLQMEFSGRPDGERPNGCESWLDYYRDAQQTHDASRPDSSPFELSDEDCARLWREGVQYYHRYLSFWHLGRHDLCARDTERNLRLFEFVRTHARTERNKRQFDQWRPYVTMMHARSVGTPLIEEGEYAEALRVIEVGIDGIRNFLDEYGQADQDEECVELVNLEKWREEILLRERRAAETRPDDAVEILRRQLREAVSAEEFEEAARLRDEIRRLSGRQ
jgi:hypothetical protein